MEFLIKESKETSIALSGKLDVAYSLQLTDLKEPRKLDIEIDGVCFWAPGEHGKL